MEGRVITQQDEREKVTLGRVYSWPLGADGADRAEGAVKGLLVSIPHIPASP